MGMKTDEIIEAIKTDAGLDPATAADLGAIEMDVLTSTTLADLIRRGAAHTVQPSGWGNAEQGEACALAGAGLAGKALGLI